MSIIKKTAQMLIIFLFPLLTLSRDVKCFESILKTEIVDHELINGEAVLWFDQYGVAHLEGKTVHDLFFLQGYANAKERFFQIDFLRKIGRGQFSEIAGLKGLPVDTFLRKFAFERAAYELLAGMSPETFELFSAYVDGVNLWLQKVQEGKENLPPEYFDLDLDIGDIRLWTIEDSAVIACTIIFMLANPFYQELTIGLPDLLMEKDIYSDLIRLSPPYKIPVVFNTDKNDNTAPEKKYFSRLKNRSPNISAYKTQRELEFLLKLKKQWDLFIKTTGLFQELDRGESNAWVISSELTSHGNPLISSDPHMTSSAYCLLFLYRMISPTQTWTGAGFPGFPGIIFGHSDHHAIGFTSLYADIMDLYEEFCPSPGNVLFKGKQIQLEKRKQNYFAKVNGRIINVTCLVSDPYTYWVPHHGPIILWSPCRTFGISLKWTGYDENNEADALLGIMMSANLEDFIKSATSMNLTAANLVYADTSGNIYYRSTGKYPIRTFSEISPPWSIHPGGGCFEWNGYLSETKRPVLLNPSRNFIVTANNDPNGVTFDNNALNEDAYIGAGFAPGFRAARINFLIKELTQKHPVSIVDMKAIQADVKSLLALRFLPHLFKAASREPQLVTPEMEHALTLLENWDLNTDKDEPESSIFHVWLSFLSQRTLEDDLFPYYDLITDAKLVARGLLFVLENPQQSETGERLFDDRFTFKHEKRDDIILDAFDLALKKLESVFNSSDMADWKWGGIHKIVLSHLLLPQYDLFPEEQGLPRGYSADGAEFTVDVASSGIDPDNQTFKHSPVLRYVAELNPAQIDSWWILSSGNGGTGGEHYGDLVDLWLKNEYIKISDEKEIGNESNIIHFVPRSTFGSEVLYP